MRSGGHGSARRSTTCSGGTARSGLISAVSWGRKHRACTCAPVAKTPCSARGTSSSPAQGGHHSLERSRMIPWSISRIARMACGARKCGAPAATGTWAMSFPTAPRRRTNVTVSTPCPCDTSRTEGASRAAGLLGTRSPVTRVELKELRPGRGAQCRREPLPDLDARRCARPLPWRAPVVNILAGSAVTWASAVVSGPATRKSPRMYFECVTPSCSMRRCACPPRRADMPRSPSWS